MKKIIAVMVVVVAAACGTAWGAQPVDILKGRLDKVVTVLKTPESVETGELRRDKIAEIVREAFDFSEISKRAVARNWRMFDDSQKAAFREVFTRMLTGRYIARLQQQYSGEEIIYLGQDLLREDRALVKTKVPRTGADVSIDYSLKLSAGDWRVYDVRVEGVSLVKNYRGQFNKFLMSKSPDRLIERLQQKADGKK